MMKVMKVLFVIVLVIWVVGLVTGSHTPQPTAAQPATIQQESPAEKVEENQRFEECRGKLKKAQQLDLLHDLKLDGGLPTVVVGPTFYTIPFETKQAFADTVNCFVTAGQHKVTSFDLLDSMTHRTVAHYSFGTLEVK